MLSRCFTLAVLVLLAGFAVAADVPAAKDDKKAEKADPNGVLKKPDPPTGRPMELGECLAIADQRQPRIRAALQSLRAAELGLQGLSGLGRIPELFSADLPVRRLQSSLGLRVAQAEVERVRQETVCAVCLMYFSHVYARQSEQTAADVMEQLDSYYKFAEELLDSGVLSTKITKQTLYGLQAIIAEVATLRLKAETGRRQSLAALREAMGVGPECDFHPATKELPIMGGDLTEAQVVRWALEKRPEITQAAAGAEVFGLEPTAQGMIRYRPQVSTLAAGTDLHTRGVPLALFNGQYRPGALAPEMPLSMVGKTEDRVARACEYAARQATVYEVTVGLVRLEAENAFIDWEQATRRVKSSKKRFEASRQALEDAQSVATTKAEIGRAHV